MYVYSIFETIRCECIALQKEDWKGSKVRFLERLFHTYAPSYLLVFCTLSLTCPIAFSHHEAVMVIVAMVTIAGGCNLWLL